MKKETIQQIDARLADPANNWMVATQEDGSDKVVSLLSDKSPVGPGMSYMFYTAAEAVREVQALVAEGYRPTGDLTRNANAGIAPQ